MQQDFKTFIHSQSFQDFELLYSVSRNNLLPYKYDKSYYLIHAFIQHFPLKYSPQNFDSILAFLENDLKDIPNRPLTPVYKEIILPLSHSTSSLSSYFSVNTDILYIDTKQSSSEEEENCNIDNDSDTEKNVNHYIHNVNNIPIPRMISRNKRQFHDKDDTYYDDYEYDEFNNEIDIDKNSDGSETDDFFSD